MRVRVSMRVSMGVSECACVRACVCVVLSARVCVALLAVGSEQKRRYTHLRYITR